MRRLLLRVLSDDPLIRTMSFQSVVGAFAEGSFMTGSAVFFTRIVGLSATQVGVGETVGLVIQFLLAVPLGRLVDRVGSKRTWLLAAPVQALFFASWLLAHDFVSFLAVMVALDLAQTWMRSGSGAYRLQVFPRETRVRGLAYMRAARNVGYTLGAAFGGIVLAFDSDRAVQAVPIITALVLLANIALIVRLPEVGPAGEGAAGPALGQAAEHAAEPRSALHNRGFLVAMICDGILGTNQVLLNTVIPLWLVTETNAPHVLLAWLFGTNTVLAVLLTVRASRGVVDVRTSLRSETRAAVCFVISCGLIWTTDSTTQWLTIALVWLGHVTVTGAELFQSAGEWGLVAELSDPRRMGEYQGVQNLGYTLGSVWAPATYTFLAMHWGMAGWLLIAGIAVGAAVAMRPAAQAAEHHLARVDAPVAVE